MLPSAAYRCSLDISNSSSESGESSSSDDFLEEPIKTHLMPVTKCRPAKILVIDDELINLMFFNQTLKKLQYECDLASDGEAGLENITKRIELLKNGSEINYSLVLIDYNMPGMLGTEVAAKICKLYAEA